MRDGKVGLETHLVLVSETRVDLSTIGVIDTEGDTDALEEHLEEDLGVEGEGCRIEGNGLVTRYEGIRAGNGVRGEEVDGVLCGEPSIGHTREDVVNVLLREGNSALLSGEGRVRAASQELEAGRTRAVGDSDSTRELDQVTSSDAELLKERLEVVDSIIDTVVSGVLELGVVEEHDGAVSSSTLELAAGREANGVVEGETKGLMGILSALVVELVLLQEVGEVEEHTAGGVNSGVLSTGAGGALGEERAKLADAGYGSTL